MTGIIFSVIVPFSCYYDVYLQYNFVYISLRNCLIQSGWDGKALPRASLPITAGTGNSSGQMQISSMGPFLIPDVRPYADETILPDRLFIHETKR